MAASYRVVRLYKDDHPREVIATGLTLEAAQTHCKDPQTSSTTATAPDAIARTAARGAWFDAYEAEHPPAYQGHANRATWAVILWARNDEAHHAIYQRLGRAHKHDPAELAAALALDLPRLAPCPDLDPAEYLDVEWHEVAAACLEDLT